METRPSLPRLALLVSLFWLLRHVAVPAARFTVTLLCVVFFVALSPFVLLAAGFGCEARLGQEGRHHEAA